MYKLFASPADNLLDAAGLSRFAGAPAREFWALRGVDLELHRGERLGIIGRNGAGKTTILKLLTQNLSPTEGEVNVRGQITALMDAGAGFNPELSGRRNAQAALAYSGLRPSEMKDALEDISEFTELGDFLDQPLKTYSQGMLARLAFASATAVRPEILIVDEVLGAGDAYFFGKSMERTKRLVESGAGVIIVSHGLDQVMRLCPNTVWLDRGRIVERGPSLEVVKAYQQFVHRLEDRRLRAKNLKRDAAISHEARENRSDTMAVRFVVSGPDGAHCEVQRVEVRRDEEVEEVVEIGAPQDADPGHPAFVMTQGSDWSAPLSGERGLCRRLAIVPGRGEPATGAVSIGLFHFSREVEYVALCRYRCVSVTRLQVEIWQGGRAVATTDLDCSQDNWVDGRVTLPPIVVSAEPPTGKTRALVRWPGEGSLSIDKVTLQDDQGRERAVFEAGASMRVVVGVRAHRGDSYPFIPTATLYRLDGILVTNLVGESQAVTLAPGDRFAATLDMGPLALGNGRYVFTVAIYSRLSAIEESEWYDLIAHGYEFEVVGNQPFDNGVFKHRGDWRVGKPETD